MNERYPIGEFKCDGPISAEQLKEWIHDIRTLPSRLNQEVSDLDDQMLDCKYRPGGWTIRQLIHHIADSHLNAYARFKMALTEENPTIKPYAEDKWAELSDSKLPVAPSLNIIEALHIRWVYLLENLTAAELKRTFNHPDTGNITVEKCIGTYAWHGNHHLTHIRNALK